LSRVCAAGFSNDFWLQIGDLNRGKEFFVPRRGNTALMQDEGKIFQSHIHASPEKSNFPDGERGARLISVRESFMNRLNRLY